MYTVSDDLAALITSPCRTWRILLEDLTSSRTLTAEAIFTANSDRESTSLSDDIELGAVCSQSWTVNIADSAGGYVGHMFRLSLYIADIEGGKMTWGRLARYKFGRIKTLTPRQIKRLGEVLGEPIPMGVCLTRWRGSDASFALRAKHAISLTRYRKTSHGVGLERET